MKGDAQNFHDVKGQGEVWKNEIRPTPRLVLLHTALRDPGHECFYNISFAITSYELKYCIESMQNSIRNSKLPLSFIKRRYLLRYMSTCTFLSHEYANVHLLLYLNK